METPNQLLQNIDNNNDNDDDVGTSTPKVTASPKTPVRPASDDSFDDDETDEMESPSFPHLIPVYHRRNSIECDLDDVRIGWDDGCGSVCYQDDDYVTGRNTRKLKRSRSSRLFSERRHRSLFGPLKMSTSQNTNSPSPRRSNINNAVIQAELNDYLGRILNCLSAKKRDRQLMKSKNEASSSSNNAIENNIVSSLLNDSADDEMMFLCSQAVEKTIAAGDNCNTINKTISLSETNSLSMVGVSPLKDTNNIINNNVYHHAAKKFKPIHSKNENVQSLCHSIATTSENKAHIDANNTVTSSNKDDSLSLLLNDSVASDDDLFSAIDLSAIEQQIVSGNETISSSSALATQKCSKNGDKEQQSKLIFDGSQFENRPAFGTSSITSNTSSVLWRRSSSISVVNEQSQSQQNVKTSSVADSTVINSRIGGNTKTTGTATRYCTPAEIEAKRERARRTLMLKFKSKNKSSS